MLSSIVYTQIDSADFCAPKPATYGTMQMVLNQDVDVIFGPECSTGRLATNSLMTDSVDY